jgi:hypothetical protein
VRRRTGTGTAVTDEPCEIRTTNPESLLTILFSEWMGIDVAGTPAPSPAAAAVRDELHRHLAAGEGGGQAA